MRSSGHSSFEEADIKAIHKELMHINKQLCDKSRDLNDKQLEIEIRENEVLLREEELMRREERSYQERENAQYLLEKLENVENDVKTKISYLTKSHADELCELRNGFDDKCRELKRMKSSFASVKKQNDDLN